MPPSQYCGPHSPPAEAKHDFSEASVAGLHDQLQRGELSSEELVQWYIDRIDAIDRPGPR